MIISCPSCRAKNRIPTARLQQHPRCGQCKTEIALNAPVPASSSAEFDEIIQGSAVPVVVDRELDIAPGPRARKPCQVARIDLHHRAANDDVASLGDCVPRVDDEVRDELFELDAVTEDRGVRRTMKDGELDAFAEQPPQDTAEVVDHLDQIDGRALEHEATAEEHEPLRQVRTAYYRIEQVLEIFALLGTLRYDVSECLAAAHDDREEVVEVVGDTPGEDAHRLHLLGMTKLHLGELALG